MVLLSCISGLVGGQAGPVEGADGDDEEEAVDHHQDKDWEMQVQSLRLIFKEAFCESYIGFGEEHSLVVPLLLQDLVSNDDCDSQGYAQSPGKRWIDDKLEQSWAPSGYLGSDEGPAQVKTHDCHPGEHGDGEEVSTITSDLADKAMEIVRKVIDTENVDSRHNDGEHIADDNLPMKIIKFRYNDIHKEGDNQEDTADEAAESIE